MNVQEFDPMMVIENSAISARKGSPDADKVKSLASNFLQRRETGRNPQIQPGVCRIGEDDIPEIIIGRHRLYAAKLANTMLPEGEEPFTFSAVVIPSTDEQALVDAIEENEWRVAANALDRAEAVRKLVDLGRKHSEVAKIFGCSDSLVGDLLNISKLSKEVQKAYLKGTMTEESLIKCARAWEDPVAQEDLLRLAVEHKEERLAAYKLIVAREKEEAAAAATPEANGKPKPKAAKGSAPISEAVKNKNNKGRAPSDKVTGKDVDAALVKLGKKKASAPATTRNAKDLRTFIAAQFGPKVTNRAEFPLSVALAEKLEEWLDKDVGDKGLKDNWLRCCGEKEKK